MTYETSAFGDGVTNTVSNVSNHFGTRVVGGEAGNVRTAGGKNETTVNFEADGPLYDEVWLPVGAVVTDVSEYGGATVATALVGAQDISSASSDTVASNVTISTAAKLVVTADVGEVVVSWTYYAV